MISESGKSSGNGMIYNYYTCSRRKKDHACHKDNVRKDMLEDAVVDLTRRHILQPHIIDRIIKAVLEIEAEERKNGLAASIQV